MRKNPFRYKVSIYENGKRRHVLGQFMSYSDAIDFYNQKLADNQTIFHKEINWLGEPMEHELILLGIGGKSVTTKPNGMGGQTEIKMKPGSKYVIKRVERYYIEEQFKYWNINKMITFKDLIKDVVLYNNHPKSVYRFNNKLLIIDDINDNYHLFIVKCKYDSVRLINLLRKFCQANGNVKIFFLYNYFNKRELYAKISEKLGIKRNEIKKITTR